MHDLGSGTSPPERGWTLFQSEVGHAERWWAGVGILVWVGTPWPDAYILEFSPFDNRVISLCLQAREQVLNAVYTYAIFFK